MAKSQARLPVPPKSSNSTGLNVCIFGAERSIHVRRWVTGLRQRGHHVDLITLCKDSDNDLGGISLGAEGKLSYLGKIGPLKEVVRKLNPDIFHAHYASSYGFLASFVDHPCKVLSVWGDDIVVFPEKNFILKLMMKRSLHKANYITCTSQFLRDTVARYGYQESKVPVIPFGIDTDVFQYVERKPSPVVRMGIAKSFLPKYGVDILIQAFGKLIASGIDARLFLAGRGKMEPQYRQLVNRLYLNQKVKFVGFVHHEKIAEFYGSLDIFVMPSVSDGESFGVAALEASATGLPVVATRVGGVPEVVVDGVTGILVERQDIDGLSNALAKLAGDPALRERMGQAGRDFVTANYLWETNLDSMENLYRKIVC